MSNPEDDPRFQDALEAVIGFMNRNGPSTEDTLHSDMDFISRIAQEMKFKASFSESDEYDIAPDYVYMNDGKITVQ